MLCEKSAGELFASLASLSFSILLSTLRDDYGHRVYVLGPLVGFSQGEP